ncbi:MAG: right-handed parallel beta-helix repeat-containing protein, partial [Chloroflexota bacterium]
SNGGGGIYNGPSGELTVIKSTINHNWVASQGLGGGIWNEGTLKVIDSTISDNTSYYRGGGIQSMGAVTISNSIISSNFAALTGGGIGFNGSLAIYDSTIIRNDSQRGGGGIFNDSADDVLIVKGSTLAQNSTEVGVYIGLEPPIADGGGIYSEAGHVSLINSTVSGNSADDNGGGIYKRNGELLIESSTIHGNVSYDFAGGISISSGQLSMKNSILAGNQSPDVNNCFWSGAEADLGGNLVGDNYCGFTVGPDPMLGPLQDNGGPTMTHALMDCSPAIDAADSSLATDQRGVIRPEGSAADIGAFEYQPDRPFPCLIFLPIVAFEP